MKTLYLDTNILLNVLLEEKDFVESSSRLLSAIEIGKCKAITSFFTLMEIHRILQKYDKKENDIERIIKTISSSRIEIDLPENMDILNAYELIKRFKIDPVDSIHLFTAIEQGAIFVSRDKTLTAKIKSQINTTIPEIIIHSL